MKEVWGSIKIDPVPEADRLNWAEVRQVARALAGGGSTGKRKRAFYRGMKRGDCRSQLDYLMFRMRGPMADIMFYGNQEMNKKLLGLP